jgi:hypothetical protein
LATGAGKETETAELSGRFRNRPEERLTPHAAEQHVGAFLTAKHYQDDVDVIHVGMMLAHGTAKIAIRFSAGIRAVRFKDSSSSSLYLRLR